MPALQVGRYTATSRAVLVLVLILVSEAATPLTLLRLEVVGTHTIGVQ